MQSVTYTIARPDTGAVLPYAVVSVFEQDRSSLAQLFNTEGAAIGNPVTADATGAITIAAANGTYVLRAISADGTLTLPDLTVQIFDLQTLANAIAAGGVAGVVEAKYATEAAMRADLTKAADTIALVYGDSDPLANDLYYKIGAAGSGPWSGPRGLLAGLSYNYALISSEAADRSAAEVEKVSEVIYRTASGAHIPDVSDDVSEVLRDGVGRVVGYRDLQGREWRFDADGNPTMLQAEADLAVISAASGVHVPGLPVDAVHIESIGSKAVAAIGVDGKRYELNGDGEWFAPVSVVYHDQFDVLIYGTSVAGLTALIRLGLRGKRVCVIEPYSNFGGAHAFGLYVDQPGGMTAADIEATIMGGVTRSIYFDQVQTLQGGTTAAFRYRADNRNYEVVAKSLVAQYAARALRGCPLEPTDVITGINENGDKYIVGVLTPSGLIKASQFIDASYEGDVMAGALGSSGYTIGRESSAQYGESAAGYQAAVTTGYLGTSYDLYTGSDTTKLTLGYPYDVDPPVVTTPGAADTLVQASNFRLPLTRNPANWMPFIKPKGYDIRLIASDLQRFRMLGRASVGADPSTFGFTTFARTDQANGVPLNNYSFGQAFRLANSAKVNFNYLDLMNANQDYPDASWSRRREIVEEHVFYQQSIMWAIANDPEVRDFGLGTLQDDANGIGATANAQAAWNPYSNNKIGLCADEFEWSTYGHGWPFWFYLREGRRMISDVVLKQQDIEVGGTNTKATSIGKWKYAFDFHDSRAWISGTDQISFDGQPPNSHDQTAIYQIPMEIILPQRAKCINLTVPVCSSISHVAWASDRLEVAYGFKGEAAGEIAAWACDNPGKAVQDMPYPTLSTRLTERGSKL